ncbi:MAG TPA: type II toxin-antitoxin system prevent-host-death family antitoxin [Bacteroides sp.]|jgi:antitoxin YefM|nr:type II toxin-antitoxin system prevent-host-death family antitoxin [Bacteroides sp.]
MLTTTISEFRNNIKKYLDNVSRDFETLIINRGKDKGIVVMSLEEYNSLQATLHEMSSWKNKKRLDEAIEQYKRGEFFEKDLIDP